MTPARPVIGVIGAGKVGTTLARLLHESGYQIAHIYSQTPQHAATLATSVGATVVASLQDVIAAVDLTLLTVPDEAIEPVAQSVAGELQGKAVIHTSGAHDASVLAHIARCGAQVGSLHPALPFADVETALRELAGTVFALEADAEPLRGWLHDIIQVLGGTALVISPGQKALYHSSLVIASNYLVTLYAVAEGLLMRIGAEQALADRALNRLVGATVVNLGAQGIPQALTGPLVRADLGTVRAHLAALAQVDEELVELYTQLARLSLPMLAARGVPLQEIAGLLEKDNSDASNNS